MDRYLALIHRENDVFGMSFPDFPGCVAGGDSFEEAVESGIEALRFHVDDMIEAGLPIPRPRSLEDLEADPDFMEDRQDSILATIPLLPHAGRSRRINFTIDEAVLAEIDRFVNDREGYSRSRFFEDAARAMLARS
ncbi:type II toxin-antitoxin system HicB family antitoxin [Geminicoccus flavidas]|uniref:type II toxin-antitoxin system HicB family antitoxin n=1 Tax=Geminicoccus flavidas TaxID=2506407 RepID=UPI00135BDA9A|nr:type II toxin-antitoxin system HicB family antitoxin [Geminicoccus flavidas]